VEARVSAQNVTLSLPKDLLKEARLLAVERGTSLSGLLAEYLGRAVREDTRYEEAQKRIRQRLRRGFNLGTGGAKLPARANLHER
jgi:hypothetical protein